MLADLILRAYEMATVTEATRPITVADSFSAQWNKYIENTARNIALMCSRRSGKTTGSILRVAKHMTEQDGWRVLYINHTRLNAKQQFFVPLIDGEARVFDGLKKRGYQVNANQSELWAKLGNGSYVQAVGCDDIADVGTKLGFLWNEIIIDEAQEYADELLRLLVTDTILPTLIDRAGTLILSGTPPEVEAGFWWEVLANAEWTQVRWSMLDNPHIKRENIVSTMALDGHVIDFENPTNNSIIVQRTVFGLLVVDRTKLMYEFTEGKNEYTELPNDPQLGVWRYAMGIDIGLEDSDAIEVGGWQDNDPEHRLYEIYSWAENHQDVDDLAAKVAEVKEMFNLSSTCADTGGHGAAKVVETLRNRLLIDPILKPASVRDSVALVNDDYRAGRMLLMKGGRLVQDSKKVTWDKLKKMQSSAFHSDPTEAWRYMHHAAQAAGYYTGKAKEPAKDINQIRAELIRLKREIQLNPYDKNIRRQYHALAENYRR